MAVGERVPAAAREAAASHEAVIVSTTLGHPDSAYVARFAAAIIDRARSVGLRSPGVNRLLGAQDARALTDVPSTPSATASSALAPSTLAAPTVTMTIGADGGVTPPGDQDGTAMLIDAFTLGTYESDSPQRVMHVHEASPQTVTRAPAGNFLTDVTSATRKVSVVIPTLNEERNIGWVLERLPALADEVILVDGRSTDNTIEVARSVRPDIRVVLETQPGKGAALRAGFAAATGEYVVMIDADGSMDPAEIVRFVDALQGGCEFVKGSRFAAGGGTADISPVRQLGNAALRTAVNLLYRTNFTDLCYGFIAFRRERLNALRLDSQGFEIETEMIARAVVASLRIGEVPSFEAARQHGESKLRAWRDGRRALKTLLHERFILPRSDLAPRAARRSPIDREAIRPPAFGQGAFLQARSSRSFAVDDASENLP